MLAAIREKIRRLFLKRFKDIEIIDVELEDKSIAMLVEDGLIVCVKNEEYEFTEIGREWFLQHCNKNHQ